MNTQRLIRLLAAVTVGCAAGCAKQAPPPGGPEDRIPPEVAGVEPVSGSTGVAPGSAVEITFSKPMRRSDVEGALHIFPAPVHPPDLDWDGSRLRLRPDTAWELDQTYIITVHGDATDHRGNRLRQTFQSAFSTGTVIDSGVLVGQIWRQQAPASGVLALCYRVDDEAMNPETDTADYVVQVDLDGFFKFEFLSPGTYRVFGLDDRDRDWLWNVGVEDLAVPATDVALDSLAGVSPVQPLFLARLDTLGPIVTDCEVVTPRFLKLDFDGAIDSASLLGMDVRLVGAGSTRPASRLYALDSIVSALYAQFDSVFPDSTYDVVWTREPPIAASDTCRFRWLTPTPGQPLAPPRLRPDSSGVWTHRPGELLLRFAEPLASVDPELFQQGGEQEPGPTGVRLVPPFVVRIELEDGMTGPVSIRPGGVVSVRGEVWPDSETVAIPLQLPAQDSTGRFELYADRDVYQDGQLKVRIVPSFAPEGALLLPVTHSEPARGSLLKGDYTLTLLNDRNGDGHWTPGWPHPFQASEHRQVLPDTLRIRARFTTEYRITPFGKNQLP